MGRGGEREAGRGEEKRSWGAGWFDGLKREKGNWAGFWDWAGMLGFGFSCFGLGWVSFLFLFLFKLTQPNLFEFKIEFEFNSNTQTNKTNAPA